MAAADLSSCSHDRSIITYVLLCGYSPFRSDDPEELMRETIRGQIEFHERYWKKPSQESKDFIKLLLQVDPSKRPTADEAAKHPVRLSA